MKKIAVVMSGLVYDSQGQILQGIFSRTEGEAISVYIFTTYVLMVLGTNEAKGACQIQRLPDLSSFDGVILAPNTIIDPDTREWLFGEIERTGVPAVSIDYERPGIASVLSGNYEGMYQLVEHLVTVHGKRRFYYLSGPAGNFDAVTRQKAFFDVMEKYGIKVEPEQVYEGNFAPQSAREARDYWEKHYGTLPDCYICANDIMAEALVIELAIRNIRVPEDVLVTGVDHSKEAMECEPQLTSVDRGYDRTGSLAYDLLQRASREDISRTQLRVSSAPVYAGSCGCRHAQTSPEESGRRLRGHMIQRFLDQQINKTINEMGSDFTRARTFDDILEILKIYIGRTDAEYFYLCMSDLSQIFPPKTAFDTESENDGAELTNGYTELMSVPLAYEKGEFTSYGQYYSREILPVGIRRKYTGVRYVVIPIHYQNDSFGYCVFGNSGFPLTHEQCYSWVASIGSAIQSVRKTVILSNTVQKLNEMWIYDPLTKVYNRAGFFHFSKEFLEASKAQGKRVYLLFLDLDGLKGINDNLGHEAGDRYIQGAANILKRVIRADELLMRYGGDEFVVMGRFLEHQRADELMRDIEAVVAAENHSGNYEFPLSISMGSHWFDPKEDVRLESVLEQADAEMYRRKRQKKLEKNI